MTILKTVPFLHINIIFKHTSYEILAGHKGHVDGCSCRKALVILKVLFVGVFGDWYCEFRSQVKTSEPLNIVEGLIMLGSDKLGRLKIEDVIFFSLKIGIKSIVQK